MTVAVLLAGRAASLRSQLKAPTPSALLHFLTLTAKLTAYHCCHTEFLAAFA